MQPARGAGRKYKGPRRHCFLSLRLSNCQALQPSEGSHTSGLLALVNSPELEECRTCTHLSVTTWFPKGRGKYLSKRLLVNAKWSYPRRDVAARETRRYFAASSSLQFHRRWEITRGNAVHVISTINLNDGCTLPRCTLALLATAPPGC